MNKIDEKLRIVFYDLLDREHAKIYKQHKKLYEYVFNHIKNDAINAANKNFNPDKKGSYYDYAKIIFIKKYMGHKTLRLFLIVEDFGGLTRYIRKEKLDLLEEF